MRFSFTTDYRKRTIRTFTVINIGYLSAGTKSGILLGLLGFNLMLEWRKI